MWSGRCPTQYARIIRIVVIIIAISFSDIEYARDIGVRSLEDYRLSLHALVQVQ
jgi:hypothetical protein